MEFVYENGSFVASEDIKKYLNEMLSLHCIDNVRNYNDDCVGFYSYGVYASVDECVKWTKEFLEIKESIITRVNDLIDVWASQQNIFLKTVSNIYINPDFSFFFIDKFRAYCEEVNKENDN